MNFITLETFKVYRVLGKGLFPRAILSSQPFPIGGKLSLF
jgi:hypothetical protein